MFKCSSSFPSICICISYNYLLNILSFSWSCSDSSIIYCCLCSIISFKAAFSVFSFSSFASNYYYLAWITSFIFSISFSLKLRLFSLYCNFWDTYIDFSIIDSISSFKWLSSLSFAYLSIKIILSFSCFSVLIISSSVSTSISLCFKWM